MGVDNLKKPTKKTKNNLPNWIIQTENGKRVKDDLLGEEIVKEDIFEIFKYNENNKKGSDIYQYNEKLGYWKHAEDRDIERVIGNKLKDYDLWTARGLFGPLKYIKTLSNDIELEKIMYEVSEEKAALNNFNNCVYDVLSGKRYKHKRSYYFLSTHGYNLPEVKGNTQQTNKWFNESFGINAQFMKEYIGYCFHKSYEPFQEFVILLGTGGNGKTTFSNYLTKLIGSDEVSNVDLNRLADSNDRFSKSGLVGKSVNIGGELSRNFIKDTSLIKALTGNDKMHVEFKGHNGINVRLYAKLLFACNELPPFRDSSDGFRRRICIVKMNTIKDFRNKYSMKAIESEIGSFALECMEAYRQAYNRNKLSITKNMEKECNTWLAENNKVQQFVNERCTLDNPKSKESLADLFKKFREFCFANNYEPGQPIHLRKELTNLGFETTTHARGPEGKDARGFKGISLKTESKTPKETHLT